MTVRELANSLTCLPEYLQDKPVKIEQFDKWGTKLDIQEIRAMGTPVIDGSEFNEGYDITSDATIVLTNSEGYRYLDNTENLIL